MQDDAKLQNTCARASGPHRPRKGRVGSKYCLTSAKITKSKLRCKMMQNCRTHVRARQARIGHDKARWVVSTLALLVVPRLLQLRSCHQEQKLGDWHQKPTTEQNAARLTYRTHVQKGQAHIGQEKAGWAVSTVSLLPRSSKANFDAR